jgi:hypothetical protein
MSGDVSHTALRLKKCKTLENLKYEIIYPFRFKNKNLSHVRDLNSRPLVY